MLEGDETYSCPERKEPTCRIKTCETNEVDPRSFCHSISATPKHVCAKTTCEKYVSQERDGKKKAVCIPRAKCQMVKHFGPTDKELRASRPKKSKGKKKDGQAARDPAAPFDDDESDSDDSDEDIDKEQQEAMDLMKNLSETLDASTMAAISALAGSDICPCCKCRICECKLRNIDEKALLELQKRAMLRRELTDEERRRLMEQLGPEEFARWEAEMRRAKYGIEEQYRMEGELGRKRKPGDPTYEYAFDYFHEPDLEAFEAEKRIKEEEERQIEIEKEKKAQEEAEQAAMEAAEEKMRQEALEQIELEALEQGVQAEPDTKENASQFYGSEQKEDLIDEFTETPVVGDKIEEWDEAKKKEGEAWTEYKAAEWAGVRHQDIPSVVESQTQEAVEQAALQYTTGIPGIDKISSHRPSIASTRKSVLPQMELALHAFDKSWLEETEKLSLEQTPRIIRPDDIPEEAQVRKPKPVEAYSQGPVLRPPQSGFKPELLPLKKKPPTAAETIQEMESLSVSSRSSRATTASKGEDFDFFVTDKDMTQKEIFLTDVCRCLPGYCTCGKQHYTFKKETETEDFGMGFRPLQVDKMIPSTAKEREKVKEARDEKDTSEQSSCSCIHPERDLADMTPVVSRIEIVAVPPTGVYDFSAVEDRTFRGVLTCREPKYQKTTIIVKPEAVRYKDVILRAIKREGLDVIDERLIQLTPEQVAEIYTENFGSAYFPMFVQQLSSSPILVIAIAGADAVKRWNAAVGPEKSIPISWFYPASMRRRFSVNSDIFDVMKLSDDFQKAKPQLRYFFPLHIIDPIIISSTMVQDYCDEFIHPTLLKALYQIVKQKPDDPIIFLAEWLLINNPFQPFYKQIHVSLAPT